FYTARSSTKPPLPWTNFAPPFSQYRLIVRGHLPFLPSNILFDRFQSFFFMRELFSSPRDEMLQERAPKSCALRFPDVEGEEVVNEMVLVACFRQVSSCDLYYA